MQVRPHLHEVQLRGGAMIESRADGVRLQVREVRPQVTGVQPDVRHLRPEVRQVRSHSSAGRIGRAHCFLSCTDILLLLWYVEGKSRQPFIPLLRQRDQSGLAWGGLAFFRA